MAEVKKSKKVTRIIGRVFTVFISTIVMIFAALYSAMWVFCHGPSTAARDLFVGTVLETGAMKFLAGWYFSKDEILKITGNNSMGHLDNDVDTSLININDKKNNDKPDDNNSETEEFDENGIRIENITGRSYMGKVMIIKDPSKLRVATIYPWSDDNKSKSGDTLDTLVNNAGAIAGINGGEFFGWKLGRQTKGTCRMQRRDSV